MHRPDHVGPGLSVARMLAEHMGGGGLNVEDDSVVVTLPAVGTIARPALQTSAL